jgi:hypothetical protein
MNCTEDHVIPGTLDAFFTGVGILVTGLFAGFVAVATLVYTPPKKAGKLPYEQKYYEEFCDLEERELNDDELSKLKDTFVCETTPDGDVIICYNKESESFDVWHDDRNIAFLVLDAVAQHYSIEHDVKNICVNYKEEYDKAIEIFNENKKKDTTDTTDTTDNENESDDVFANFKSYNKASDKSKTTENRIVPEKCNRFRRVGSIKDWHDVHDKNEEEPDDSKNTKQFSYEEFKAMQKKSVEGDVVHSDSEVKKEK